MIIELLGNSDKPNQKNVLFGKTIKIRQSDELFVLFDLFGLVSFLKTQINR